jgi:hypothetical protein
MTNAGELARVRLEFRLQAAPAMFGTPGRVNAELRTGRFPDAPSRWSSSFSLFEQPKHAKA